MTQREADWFRDALETLTFEQWTANTFLMAVFAEISALVLLVVKYLFPVTTDKILELIDRFRGKEPHG